MTAQLTVRIYLVILSFWDAGIEVMNDVNPVRAEATVDEIKFFLASGYFPPIAAGLPLCQSVCQDTLDKFGSSDLDALTDAAYFRLLAICDEQLSTYGNIIPLSGGIDSRLILAALQTVAENSRLETFTYGTPGTYDFELGLAVAARAGVRSAGVDLDKLQLTEAELVARSNAVGRQTEIHFAPSVMQLNHLLAGKRCWSGVIGDIAFGSAAYQVPKINNARDYLRQKTNLTDEESIARFAKRVSEDDHLASIVGKYESYLFTDRLPLYYRPVTRWGATDVCEPFLDKQLLAIMFLARKLERYQYEFRRKFIKRVGGKLFNIPVKNNFGQLYDAPAWRVSSGKFFRKAKYTFGFKDPAINYYSVRNRLKRDEAFSSLVYNMLASFSDRKITDDLMGVSDLALARTDISLMMRIFSLEIHLRSGLNVVG